MSKKKKIISLSINSLEIIRGTNKALHKKRKLYEDFCGSSLSQAKRDKLVRLCEWRPLRIRLANLWWHIKYLFRGYFQ